MTSLLIFEYSTEQRFYVFSKEILTVSGEIWGLLSLVIPLCPYFLPLFLVLFNIHVFFLFFSFYIAFKNQKLS